MLLLISAIRCCRAVLQGAILLSCVLNTLACTHRAASRVVDEVAVCVRVAAQARARGGRRAAGAGRRRRRQRRPHDDDGRLCADDDEPHAGHDGAGAAPQQGTRSGARALHERVGQVADGRDVHPTVGTLCSSGTPMSCMRDSCERMWQRPSAWCMCLPHACRGALMCRARDRAADQPRTKFCDPAAKMQFRCAQLSCCCAPGGGRACGPKCGQVAHKVSDPKQCLRTARRPVHYSQRCPCTERCLLWSEWKRLSCSVCPAGAASRAKAPAPGTAGRRSRKRPTCGCGRITAT